MSCWMLWDRSGSLRFAHNQGQLLEEQRSKGDRDQGLDEVVSSYTTLVPKRTPTIVCKGHLL